MILQIPKLTNSFFKNGFDALSYNALFEPTRVLGSSTDQIYLDTVLVTLLSYAKQSKKVLDLGSYFGMLPFIVEDFHRRSNAKFDIEWTLVDNCMYVKELYQYIKGTAPLSGDFMSFAHAAEWSTDKIPRATRELFDSHADSCLPPINAEQFQLYWKKLAADYLNVECPNMTMYEDIALLEGQKFDFAIFDLSAGLFENSVKLFNDLQNYVTDDAIILIDDISPSHPETMALFQHIMKTYNYAPVAFSPGKIAVMHPEHKEKFLLQAENYIVINELTIPNLAFSCQYKVNEVWGPYIQLKTS
jgi:hypothetical protein